MKYIAKGNICVKGNFVKEGEIIALNQNEAKKYLDALMIEVFKKMTQIHSHKIRATPHARRGR